MTCVLPGGLGQIKPAAGGSGFNTSTIAGGGVLSNNNKTITTGSAANSVATGTLSHNSGKYYFEVAFTTLGGIPGGATTMYYMGVGVVDAAWNNATQSTNGTGIGGDANGDSAGLTALVQYPAWYAGQSGNVSYTFGNNNIASGDVIGVAVDFTYSGGPGLWYRRNTLWLNNGAPSTTFIASKPDAGMSPLQALWPGVSVDANSVITLNTGGAAFANAPPAGFVAWG